MPYIHISTSNKLSDTAKDRLIEDFGREIEILKGKSEQWLMIKISDEQSMCFQGTREEPCGIIEVSVYGTFSAKEYQKLTEALTKTASEAAAIPKNRIYVKYFETPYWGWDGSNF